jgi:flagellar hook assembly protein FlgD
VEVAIYNVVGQRIRTLVHEYQSAGEFKIRWDATNDRGDDVSTGIYLCSLRTTGFLLTRKIMLIK